MKPKSRKNRSSNEKQQREIKKTLFVLNAIPARLCDLFVKKKFFLLAIDIAVKRGKSTARQVFRF